MEKKLTKIIGLKKSEFDELVASKQIKIRESRLIPFSKPGDEISLSSVLLSSMRLIKEFRRNLLTDLKMTNAGKIHAYTEVVFANFKDDRPDGLIIIEKGGVIVDAALMELKTGSEDLNASQIERYTLIAKELSIPRILTVSNQFVSESTQSPLSVKNTKSLSYYHFSWSYILTVGHLLLSTEGNSISDEDQKEIMMEVLNYFESEKSGICGFNQMKKGWTDVVNKIHTNMSIRTDEESTKEAVVSWQQEEMDIALKLSRSLGILVSTGESKYKMDLNKRLEDDAKTLASSHALHSVLRVKGAASRINVSACFKKRAIEMNITLKPPFDRKLKGQVGWLEKQLRRCETKEKARFDKSFNQLYVDIFFKNTSASERVPIKNLLEFSEKISGKELRDFNIVFCVDFGKDFASRTKFVSSIEEMAEDFYKTIVENVKAFEMTAPKLKEDSHLTDTTSPIEVVATPVTVEPLVECEDTAYDPAKTEVA